MAMSTAIASSFAYCRIIDDHRLMIAAFLPEREADLRFILHAYSFEDLSRPDRIGAVFRHLQTSANAFVDIGVFDAGGLHVAYQGPYPLTGKVYGEEAWFREVMEKVRFGKTGEAYIVNAGGGCSRRSGGPTAGS